MRTTLKNANSDRKGVAGFGIFLVAVLVLAWCLCPQPTKARDGVDALLGVWIQDDTGPVLSYRRAFYFRPGGYYEFVVTSGNTGSLQQRVLGREEGTFTADGSRLTISPRNGPAMSLAWRIEKDPYVGDIRLVIVRPDGMLDVYYRR